MAAVTIYLNDELAKAAKAKADEKKESLSSYLAELVERDTRRQWSPAFLKLLETRDVIEFNSPPDAKPDEVEGL